MHYVAKLVRVIGCVGLLFNAHFYGAASSSSSSPSSRLPDPSTELRTGSAGYIEGIGAIVGAESGSSSCSSSSSLISTFAQGIKATESIESIRFRTLSTFGIKRMHTLPDKFYHDSKFSVCDKGKAFFVGQQNGPVRFYRDRGDGSYGERQVTPPGLRCDSEVTSTEDGSRFFVNDYCGSTCSYVGQADGKYVRKGITQDGVILSSIRLIGNGRDGSRLLALRRCGWGGVCVYRRKDDGFYSEREVTPPERSIINYAATEDGSRVFAVNGKDLAAYVYQYEADDNYREIPVTINSGLRGRDLRMRSCYPMANGSFCFVESCRGPIYTIDHRANGSYLLEPARETDWRADEPESARVNCISPIDGGRGFLANSFFHEGIHAYIKRDTGSATFYEGGPITPKDGRFSMYRPLGDNGNFLTRDKTGRAHFYLYDAQESLHKPAPVEQSEGIGCEVTPLGDDGTRFLTYDKRNSDVHIYGPAVTVEEVLVARAKAPKLAATHSSPILPAPPRTPPLSWCAQHRNHLIAGAGAVAVLVASGVAYRYYHNRKKNKK